MGSTPRLRTSLSLLAIAVVLGALLGHHQRWFATEPVHAGRTVTEWLDRMPLFADLREREAPFNWAWPSEVVNLADDPSIRAVVALGSNAVPTLQARLVEGPGYPASARLSDRRSWRTPPLLATAVKWPRTD